MPGMRNRTSLALLLVLLLPLAASAVSAASADAASRNAVFINAHSHNDYLHARPCLDALDCGFCSIEADVYLVDGKLLVAHDRSKLKPERTLAALYLDPLRQCVDKNAGRVYRHGPTVTLLIDIKDDADQTYAALRELLKEYAPMITTFEKNRTMVRAVTVIVSGNRPRKTMEQETLRYAALDGRLEDLKSDASEHLMPLISSNWMLTFKWRGQREMTDTEKQLFKSIVEKAHASGRRIRFWAIPDNPAGWEMLLSAGVDLINTDKLTELREFLLARSARTQPLRPRKQD